jgi:hypothetical protein
MYRTKWIILVLMGIISCKEKSNSDYPLVFTGDVINVTDSSATFTAKISNIGILPILESGFIWDIHSSYKNGFKVKNDITQEGVYEINIDLKLLPDRTYYVRPYIQTESLISYGKEVTFNTTPRQIKIGKWSQVYYTSYNGAPYFNSSFTLNDSTFFVFEGGTMYYYSHINNTFGFVLSNPILLNAFVCKVFKDTVYIFSQNSVYSYDSKSKIFNILNNLNVSSYMPSSFLINDNIYIGLGILYENNTYTKKIRCYNISNNSWKDIAPFPGNFRFDAYSFSLKNKGYIGGGLNQGVDAPYPYPRYHDLWCYNPETDQWEQKEGLPITDQTVLLKGTYVNDYGYCLFGTSYFEYNPTFDTWESMAELKINRSLASTILFSSKDKMFLVEVAGYLGDRYLTIWAYEK